MILNKAQAEAVYSAMCALSNVGALIDVNFPQGNGLATRFYENPHGVVFVKDERGASERHADQDAFAEAYGLQ